MTKKAPGADIPGTYPRCIVERFSTAYSEVYFDNSKIIRETDLSFIPIKKSVEDTILHY
jgi:hypothetical protein